MLRAATQGTHDARCTVAPPTVQLCSRAPSPRCERHLLHRAAPCTTVQADFPAPSCIGTDGVSKRVAPNPGTGGAVFIVLHAARAFLLLFFSDLLLYFNR